MEKGNILYIVVPCYNEEDVLLETTKRLNEKISFLIQNGKISSRSKVMYIDDGSSDNTWSMIKKFNKENFLFTGICLSRNRGHQNALLAGLMTAKNYADVVISMDADLQDDIDAIDEMLDKYYDGNEIVYGVRSSREKDTWFKRYTAETFYKFMSHMGVKDVIYNHADYRLTSKRVLESFSNYKEVNLFLRGMFPLVGYKSAIVYYERKERFAGTSKYPLKKMLNFAWDGITSFSTKPIRIILIFGIIILTVSVLSIVGLVVSNAFGNIVSPIFYLICSVWLVGSIQICAIGIIGEYIGKTYFETKERPRYIISENLEETIVKKIKA